MSGSARWGWHRLDARAAERLVADAHLPPHALVVDIGAGDGAITRALVAAGHRVVAVELHPDRVRRLRTRFGNLDTVTVVRADARDLRLPRRSFHVVANPPFAASAQIVRRLLHPGSRLETARLILQDQTTRRWASAAAPGRADSSRQFSLVAGPRVPRQSFVPPPPVNTRILEITRRPLRRP